VRTLVRCIALAPVALLVVLLVLTHVVADWLERHEPRTRSRGDHEGASHA
jgi:hypothetical protein